MTNSLATAQSKHSPSLLNRVTHAMWWNTVLTPLKALISFVANVIVVRALTQEAFSNFAVIIALLSTLGFYVDIGIERSVIRFIPDVEQSYGRRGLVEFFLGVMGFKILVTLPIIGAIIYYGGWGNPLTLIFGLLLVLGAFSDMLTQYLLAYFRQKGRNALDIVTTFAQAGFLITFVLLGWGVLGALWALTLATIVNVVLGTVLVWRAVHDLQVVANHSHTWRNIFHRLAQFSLTSYLMGFLVYFNDSAFVVLAMNYSGEVAAVGLFNVAFSRVVMPVLRLMFTPLTGVQLPMFARLRGDNDHGKFDEAYRSITRLLALMLIPAAVGLALVAQPIIVLFFQARYAEAADAAAWLALFLFAESLFAPSEVVLKVHDRYRAVFLTRLPSLITIPLLFWLAPMWGAVGAAWAIGFGRVLGNVVMTAYAVHALKLSFPYAFVGRVTTAAFVMGIAVWLVANLGHSASPLDHTLKLSTSMSVGVIVFCIIFRLLGGLETRDKERLLLMRIPFKRQVVNWL